ncbi:DUF4249 domain-containing protein [Catalinimonas niigatensis]|uniref:DUF4249 domain-containing protein n=1 Tax=Catalinimonas niigatensis TaxID=1397264 RepID=UPI00266612D7|nr:DUF4249 domain-containing protein [Catalinimonas niigatensis]WPP52444.1 DUF4249 domain-containing protein [Catalinimonas niigatensis]
MKTIIKLILLSFSATAFFSCDEPIELDLKQTPPQYVVDALITDQLSDHYVKLTRSVDFYTEGKTPGVSGAEVEVSDNEGNTYQYLESETEAGLYTANFEGKPGNTYSLQIVLPDGETLSAEEEMAPLASIDSLVWDIDERAQDDPEEEGLYYRIRIYAREPAETKDYYLFKFFRNDSIQNFDSNTGVFYADDELISGYINGLESPELYREGDEATFEMYRISRDAFLFYNDLDNILNGDGGMYGPSPANPRTNVISNDGLGLGLFQVSALDRTTIVVGE